MKKLVLAVLALFLFRGFAGAEEGKKPFFMPAVGDFWKFEIEKRGKKEEGAIEIVGIDENGKLLAKFENGHGDLKWSIKDGFLVWQDKDEKSLTWKVLKLDAEKGDSWRTEAIAFGADAKMVIRSEVVAVENIETPAGRFEECVKVRNFVPGEKEVPVMWWARGVGLVKLEIEGDRNDESWKLVSYRVGDKVTKKALEEMIGKSETVALVKFPQDVKDSHQVKAEVVTLFKGSGLEEGRSAMIARPSDPRGVAPFKPGEFVVFLDDGKDSYGMIYTALESSAELLERVAELVAGPPEVSADSLKSLVEKAEIIVAGKIVVLEDRGAFKYYVVQIEEMARGPEGREYLDVLRLECGDERLKIGEKYIFFLKSTRISGRSLVRPLGEKDSVIEGSILGYDEELFGEIRKAAESSR